MDFIADLEALSMASRMRRLSEQYLQMVTNAYQSFHVPFDAKWFPVFCCVAQHGPISIMEIADLLQITHPGVIQLAKELEKESIISSGQCYNDKRRRLLCLTPKGEEILLTIKPLWTAFIAVNNQLMNQQEHRLLSALGEMEELLRQNNYLDMVKKELQKQEEKVIILDYNPIYKSDFKQLNLAWIEQYFVVEPHDIEQLDQPEKYILINGGQIFLAQYQSKIVGAVALVHAREGIYEMAKMAVSPEAQGLGIGRLLGDHLLAAAKQKGATKVVLDSNRKLETAIHLYRKLGFQEIENRNTLYARSDIQMSIDLV